MLTLASACIVVAALYFGQEVLIPVSLAVLLSFLLTPVVTQLERWKLGRVPSVLAVVLLVFGGIGALGYVVGEQVVQLANDLPKYQDNIVTKVQAVRGGSGGFFSRLSKGVGDVQKKLEQPASMPTSQATTNPAAEAVAQISTDKMGVSRSAAARATNPEANGGPSTQPYSRDNPMPVAVIEPQPSPLQMLGKYAGLVLGPLGTAGLVVVLVIFMLLQREDLRDRLIRLVTTTHSQLTVTTQALDDAATRISRYLLMQAIVNGSYGVIIAFGLWLVGRIFGNGTSFPNYLLWGLLCALLRFIPYIGPWVASIFPVALALLAYPGLSVFAGVMGLFLVVELFSNNVMEPWLYGSSTGMSTVAILVSAVFWTWLWGPIGLLMSTPLTVCLVVIGKYVPQMGYLDTLLGDTPVLSFPQRVYQRWLALDQEEVADVVEEFAKDHPLEAVYDDVLLPALSLAEQDRHRGALDDRRREFIRSSMRDLIDELGDRHKVRMVRARADAVVAAAKGGADAPAAGGPGTPAGRSGSGIGGPNANGSPGGAVTDVMMARIPLPKDCKVNVVLLPAHDEADEIVGLMLAQLLELQGYCAVPVSQNALASEMLDVVTKRQADVVVVSALPPSAVTHSRYLCKRLHARYPDVTLVVGLWTVKGENALRKARDRIVCEHRVQLSSTLAQALDHVHQLVQPLLMNPRPDPAANPTTPGALIAPAAP